MKLVGFVGRKGSGKDTAVQYLLEKGVLQQNVKFAWWLKQRCAELFDTPWETFEDPKLKDTPFLQPFVLTAEVVLELTDELGYGQTKGGNKIWSLLGKHLRTPREVLQTIGTDIVRALDSNWHILQTFRSIDQTLASGFSDVRFENEIQAIQKRGGTVYFIDNCAEVPPWEHVSEKVEPLKSLCDGVLLNNGTLEDFYEELDRTFQRS